MFRCFGPQAPVQDNSSSTGQPTEPRDFFRDALSTSGIGYDTEDDKLADISPQQVNKVDILSLGLPRLTTGRNLCMLYLLCSYSSLDIDTQNHRYRNI